MQKSGLSYHDKDEVQAFSRPFFWDLRSIACAILLMLSHNCSVFAAISAG
jgi:hypothetical protein